MSNYQKMPWSLCEKLNGKTIGDALFEKIIDNLGNENREFIFKGLEDPDSLYAVIQGYAVKLSQNLIDSEMWKTEVKDLSFFIYSSNDGIRHFRLCRPKYINLGEAIL